MSDAPFHDIEFALKFIASSMAPAVIFIAVGLLLAGLQMKYTALITVMRQLNSERRDECERRLRDGQGGGEEEQRLESIREQMNSLLRRAWLIRSSVLCLYGSVLLFLLASFAVGAAALGAQGMTVPIIALFASGLAAVLLGIVFAYREARLSYDVVAAEVRDLEEAGQVEVPR